MEKSWGFIGVILAFAIFELCNGLPMDLLSHHDGPNAQLIGVLVGVMVSVCVVIAFVGCVCCQRRQGFKENENENEKKVFRDSPVSASVINETSLSDDPGHINPIANPEFTIFTPLSPPHHNNNVFRSNQPVISYIQNENVPELPNKLVNPHTDGIDVSSWFDGSQPDFPRSKLKYIRELGNGWFGRVVEGEAQDITVNTQNGWTPVVVRILESSASAREQALFLHEANMYRNNQSSHPHIIYLFGRSLEATPLLLIQEFCPKGNLKKFLIENRSSSSSSAMTGVPLKFCCQLASAVQFLHDKNMPHLDLAARTCQITSDLNIKLGDYGLAVSQYPHDYYQGTPAIPVRWCAPETLNYTKTTLQPKQITCEGNIWSLGVTMWEICEWGNQPYVGLTDDEVITQVMGAPNIRLPLPSLNVYYIQPLYRLMQLCWQPNESRPQINQIYSMLMHLLQQYQQNNASKSPSRVPNFPMEDFDCRWETFKPNTIVKTDNHMTLNIPTDKITDVSSVSSSEIFVNPEKQKSPSLTNLHGSLENLVEDEVEIPVQNMDSWLQNVANHTSDMQYVRGLSQAIQALDSALASEQTSSSASSFEPSPAPESLETSQDQHRIEFKLNQQISTDESSNLMDSIMYRRTDSGSETEDETWKRRIERGAYSEKVRQKSKSVADLMILTHIDCSDTDSETPQQSLEYRVNYKNVRCKPNTSLESSSLMFGSEGNLLEVQDTFQEELKKLQEERRDSLLFVPACHSSQIDIQTASDDNIVSFTNAEYDDGMIKSQESEGKTVFQEYKVFDESISAIMKSDNVREICINKTLPVETSDLSVESENLIKIIDDKIKTELDISKKDTKDDNQNKIFSDMNYSESNQTTQDNHVPIETTKIINETDENKEERNKSDSVSNISIENQQKVQLEISNIDTIEIKDDSKKEDTRNINDTFIRQEAANLIKEISFEAEEKVFGQNNHRNDNSESQIQTQFETDKNKSDTNEPIIQNMQKEDLTVEKLEETKTQSDNEKSIKPYTPEIEPLIKVEIEVDNIKTLEVTESSQSNTFILNEIDSQLKQFPIQLESSEIVEDNTIPSRIQDPDPIVMGTSDVPKSLDLNEKSVELIQNLETSNINSAKNREAQTKMKEIDVLLEFKTEMLNESHSESDVKLIESDISSDLVKNLEENVMKTEEVVEQELEKEETSNIGEIMLNLQEPSETKKDDSEFVVIINPSHLVKSSEEPEIFTTNVNISQENLQELHNVDNLNKPVEISKIISCTKEEYSLVQNFINNERNGPFVELDKITDNSTKSEECTEPSLIPVNLLDLHDTSNTQPMNQVYNVYSVQIDHKPPPDVFESPIKNFYTKPFNETELITGISDLILESECKTLENKSPEKLLSKLNLVCTSSLQNDRIFNVLNTPPLINGFDSDLSNKIKVNLKDENKILRENCHDSHKYEVLKNVIINSTMPNSQESIVNNDFQKENDNNTVKILQTPSKVLNDTEMLSKELLQNDSKMLAVDVTFEIIKENNNCAEQSQHDNFDCTSPKKLSDLASDILIQHCLYMNENSELKGRNITSDSVNINNNSTNETYYNPRKLSDIILESLTNNPEYKNESIASADLIKNEICNETKNINNLTTVLQEKNEIKENNHFEVILPSIVTSTPFKTLPKNIEDIDSLSESTKMFSFVSESDEASDSQTTVILGPCDDYALGLYSGLKTTFEQYYDDDRPEEEILQFSSNFMPLTDESIINESQYFPVNQLETTNNTTVDFSLETWDRFLGKTLQDHENGPSSIFDHDNFTPRNDSSDVFNNKNSSETINKSTELQNQTVDLQNKTTILDKPIMNNETFNIDDDSNKNANTTFIKPEDDEKPALTATFVLEKVEDVIGNIDDTETAVLNSWEPGEGWFLHPQVPPESLTGDIDISASDNIDENSYVRFTLDEECVNALRNELAAKLPHALGSNHEEELEPEEWDSEERNEVIVKYNVYATPLSPIPEESCCDDVYCDQIQHHRDGSDTDSDWSEPYLGRTSQLEDILVVDTETHTAQLLESPSFREPQHRHTPSQDSCCSNDTLFNLEDLNYGLIDNESPLHHGFYHINQQNEIHEKDISECETPKQESPTKTLDNENSIQQSNTNSDSIELNLTYTKPDINIDISENDISNKENTTITINSAPAIIEDSDVKHNKLELKLDAGTFGVAPLPSPEDIPWKQIPASLLTYNEMVHSQNDKYEMQAQTEDISLDNNLTSEETTETLQDNNEEDGDDDVFHNNDEDAMVQTTKETVKLDEDLSDSQKESTLDTDLYSNLTDIRFSGPCDAQLMSTSFSESVDYADERDWDSGSDTRSSSSGEFIWKEGEHEESLRALHAASHDAGVTEDINPMDAIEEEHSSEDSDDFEEDIEETEFVPSAWDAQATPTKSALKSPEKSSKLKNQKGVSFKKQKYHCVYEYPREPESPVQPANDLWRPLSDFPNFADWELDPDACVPHYDDNPLDCRDGPYDPVLDRFIPKTNYSLSSGNSLQRDLYQVNPFPDANSTGLPPPTEDDFYISSTTRPFQTSSQFFPGQTPKNKFLWQDYQSSSSQSSRDLSDNITPDSGIDDVTPASLADAPNINDIVPLSPLKNKVHSLKYLAGLADKKNSANAVKNQEALGGLRHTRSRLKLDLPPSPNSFTSNRTFSIDISSDPVTNREIPTFTTFGKTRFSVQHVPTPTEDSDSSSSTGKPKAKNVSFEALPHKPHMQPINTVYIVNKPEESDTQKPVVESVQGEASLLDSADEDSGIESSANATLERREQQILN